MAKSLSTLSLALMTVGSVDSIRNLPSAALAGSDLFYYFLLAALLFLLPCAIISVWFTRLAEQGIYGWVKYGLNSTYANIAICLQWLQNIIIFPTFLSFIMGSLLFLVEPTFAQNKYYLLLAILITLWSLTWLNLKGLRLSSFFNNIFSSIGLLIPFLIIISIGCYFLVAHSSPLQHLAQSEQRSWSALTGIMLSFCGLEVAAVHISKKHNHRYLLAIVFAVVIIFISMLLGALTLAMLLPSQQLNFITELPKLFRLFFDQLGFSKIADLIIFLIAMGNLACANNWLLAPIKGIHFALNNYQIFSQNTKRPPPSLKQLLIFQAVVISLISSLFLLFSSLNESYWYLMTLATQMYLLMYCLMFMAAITILKKKQKTLKVIDKIIFFTAGLGLIATTCALIVSFQAPAIVLAGDVWLYEIKLGAGFLTMLLIMLAIYHKSKFGEIQYARNRT